MSADLTPERWRRLSALLDEALELPAERRGPLLAAAHSEDAEMGRIAAEMLKAAEFAVSPMEGLPFDAAGSLLREIAGEAGDGATPEAAGHHARAGEAFGAYRLEGKIGEGGMGEVWLAEQSGPLRRRVALKIIKAGLQSRHVIARFEAERQALALMEHPAIARVFDAGVTPWGFPYFVMEYVQGESITAYCDRHGLSIERRLNLFVQVCDGVQHAHQKGIIHRDIKPSNVLVSGEPGKPVTKIIDFGLAKATQRLPADESALTQSGMLLGTPEYMSPEQAQLGSLDVDTRTDVYALGVLLYELLTGVRPLDLKEIPSAGFDEVRQRILTMEPLRPSARVEKLGGKAASVCTLRRCTDVPALKRRLTGDLDWITMKALEKERPLRYASAAALAEDVERHLADEPVWAGPPSAKYRARVSQRPH
jgi:serine/threonine protein kinase